MGGWVGGWAGGWVGGRAGGFGSGGMGLAGVCKRLVRAVGGPTCCGACRPLWRENSAGQVPPRPAPAPTAVPSTTIATHAHTRQRAPMLRACTHARQLYRMGCGSAWNGAEDATAWIPRRRCRVQVCAIPRVPAHAAQRAQSHCAYSARARDGLARLPPPHASAHSKGVGGMVAALMPDATRERNRRR